MFPRLLAWAALVASAGFAAGQTGPTLLTVFPPGAKAVETVEVVVSGTGLDGDETLLFSTKGIKAERVGTVAATEPKAKQPAPKAAGPPTTAVKFKVTANAATPGVFDVRVVS